MFGKFLKGLFVVETVVGTIFVWNLVVFLMYGKDKLSAKKNGWRISEKTLVSSAFMLGGIGALLGMKVWRHKTKHTLFKVLIPISAAITAMVIMVLLQP